MIALSCQTMELMNKFKQAREAHPMYRHVPAFQACRCQRRGIRQSTNPKNATIGNRGYVGSAGVLNVIKSVVNV